MPDFIFLICLSPPLCFLNVIFSPILSCHFEDIFVLIFFSRTINQLPVMAVSYVVSISKYLLHIRLTIITFCTGDKQSIHCIIRRADFFFMSHLLKMPHKDE